MDGAHVHGAEATVVAGLGQTQIHHGLTVTAWEETRITVSGHIDYEKIIGN